MTKESAAPQAGTRVRRRIEKILQDFQDSGSGNEKINPKSPTHECLQEFVNKRYHLPLIFPNETIPEVKGGTIRLKNVCGRSVKKIPTGSVVEIIAVKSEGKNVFGIYYHKNEDRFCLCRD